MNDRVPICPIARTAEILGSKWTALILRDLLYRGPRRFQDFIDALDGIAPTILSARLKMLEDAGIIDREKYEDHPPRFDYRLTSKGEKLGRVLNAMRDWGAKYG